MQIYHSTIYANRYVTVLAKTKQIATDDINETAYVKYERLGETNLDFGLFG